MMNIQTKLSNTNKWFTALVVILAFGVSACSCFTKKPMEEAMAAPEPVAETVAMEPPPEPEPIFASDDVHVVAAGQSLWRISGMPTIYNDPYRWPLIYARNKDIEDADLIYPGQELMVRRDLMRTEIDAAIQHARTRGAWALGVVEESDVAYRSSAMMN